MYGRILCLPADLPGGNPHTVGQDITQPFPSNDLFKQGDHGVAVAPGNVDTVGIGFAQDTAFKTLHGKCEHAAG